MNNLNGQLSDSLGEPANKLITPRETNRQMKFLIIITLICVILFISISIYLFSVSSSASYKQNKQTIASEPAIPTQPKSLSETNEAKNEQYKIIDGSLYKVLSNKEQFLIINKDSLKNERLKVYDIYAFEFSPDNSKILLITFVGLTPFALFYYDLNSKNITFVDLGEKYVWSPNSRYIAYTRGQSDAGPRSIFVFDTISNKDIELTKFEKKNYTNYENIRWASDSAAINSEFTTTDEIPNGKVVDKGETIIKIK